MLVATSKFYIKLYDKRNDYDFDVISFPYLNGDIPKGQSYEIFISQLIRYARINTSFSNYISDCKKLVTKLVGQYFDVAALRKRFQVFINKHFNVRGKYGVPLSVNHVFVTHHRPFTVISYILLIIVTYLFICTNLASFLAVGCS